MWTDPDEARSDFVLAAATALFGPFLAQFILRLPVLGSSGPLGRLVGIALLFAITGLVPLLLARHRGAGIAAFGLDGGREGIRLGFLLALPVAALGVVVAWTSGVPILQALTGILALFFGSPFGPLDVVFGLLQVIVIFGGMLLLYTFLGVKAREGFGRTEVSHVEALRTYGLAAAGGALLVGFLVAIGREFTLSRVLLSSAALAAVVLIADRVVDSRGQTTRLAVLAPAIVALVLAWNIFSGEFLTSLRHGLLAAGTIIVVTVLVDGRRYAWAAVPLFAALTIYPVELRPL